MFPDPEYASRGEAVDRATAGPGWDEAQRELVRAALAARAAGVRAEEALSVVDDVYHENTADYDPAS